MSNEEFKEKYHIDHVQPLSTFDYSIPKNQYKAFSSTNCQPRLKEKNLNKGNK